ncbi:hypothetical protein THOE12_300005 [Vibrio rotiferianus]|nr:hypothetical protein THOE12_300005 [Vibrio rotiferianus]
MDLLLVVVTPLTIITTVRVIQVLPRRKVTIYIELSVSSGTIYVGNIKPSFKNKVRHLRSWTETGS